MKKEVITLEVSLDTSTRANPHVAVSPESLRANGASLRWLEADDSPDFEFVSLAIDDAAFPNPDVSLEKRRITCDNNNSRGKFEYTIKVKKGGRYYSSDLRHSQGRGRTAVIRNQ